MHILSAEELFVKANEAFFDGDHDEALILFLECSNLFQAQPPT